MRAHEFLNEGGMKSISAKHKAALKNVHTSPDQNMNSGSAYKHYRFGLALAGAPEETVDADNYIGGDPFYSAYTPEEVDMINHAARQVGDKSMEVWTDGKSSEVDNVNTTSPVAKPKRNKFGV